MGKLKLSLIAGWENKTTQLHWKPVVWPGILLVCIFHENENVCLYKELYSFKCSGFIHNLASNLKQPKYPSKVNAENAT